MSNDSILLSLKLRRSEELFLKHVAFQQTMQHLLIKAQFGDIV